MKVNAGQKLNVILMVLRFGLGGVLVWSSLPKLRLPYEFLAGVYRYELLGIDAGVLVAIVVPWLELFIGICLVGGLLIGGALLSTAALMSIFVGIQIWALAKGLSISCSCFGPSNTHMVGYGTILRTILLLLAALSGVALWGTESRQVRE